MTPDLRVHQGLLASDSRGIRVVGASDRFPTPEAERIAVLFGTRPAGVACPLAHFACPVGKQQVAIVQVADRHLAGSSEVSLAFRFLVMSRSLYFHLGDPFAIADCFPPAWNATGTLAELAWPEEVLPPRQVEDVRRTLKHGDSGLLLGGAQALIDGSRIVLERTAPEETTLRSLWLLLPTRSRRNLWPASFAFSNELGFHAVALPYSPGPLHYGSLNEEQVRDYPSSRYELNLQIAAEDGDQAELDRLLDRRTSQETLRLGLSMVVIAFLLAFAYKLLL